MIKKFTKWKLVSLIKFQQLAGKLQHASFGIPGGKGLFSPIYQAIKKNPDHVPMTQDLKQTLTEWHSLVQHLALLATPVKLLVLDYPNYIVITDACGLGAGGVLTPGISPLNFWVWKF